ncbi:MAG: hypothetical protein ABDH32_01170 [Candidatus Caldarchaeales archaeon]
MASIKRPVVRKHNIYFYYNVRLILATEDYDELANAEVWRNLRL